ncbi:R3H domain-containing nucleic acid-binding protein [Leptolyngbya sp. FACHB-261]|uniref:Jag family protein n=1 Tax=Leptolyngbya sp. FACHB-261 TaxID=2692806 RepID=UPI0016868514|nr:R3H domain-containing nucleic acid-binding protein [Leptolyngbya sp. FACHB-261]MBD2103850.1 RNA-binding protein [Leptolyngbya sp. FACHB-261]
MSNDPSALGKQWLEQLLNLMSCPAVVEPSNPPQGDDHLSQWLEIDEQNLTPHQVNTLLGREGSTLDAIQYLANTTLNLHASQESQCAYTVELAGYRLRRQAELQEIAATVAERVRASGEAYEMPALSSAERRQVHMFFKTQPDLESFSQGREPDRRLVVRMRQEA